MNQSYLFSNLQVSCVLWIHYVAYILTCILREFIKMQLTISTHVNISYCRLKRGQHKLSQEIIKLYQQSNLFLTWVMTSKIFSITHTSYDILKSTICDKYPNAVIELIEGSFVILIAWKPLPCLLELGGQKILNYCKWRVATGGVKVSNYYGLSQIFEFRTNVAMIT